MTYLRFDLNIFIIFYINFRSSRNLSLNPHYREQFKQIIMLAQSAEITAYSFSVVRSSFVKHIVLVSL